MQEEYDDEAVLLHFVNVTGNYQSSTSYLVMLCFYVLQSGNRCDYYLPYTLIPNGGLLCLYRVSESIYEFTYYPVHT